MATTPRSDPLANVETLLPKREYTYEEVVELVRAFQESVAPYIPKDWDQDAELKAEHEAVLAGSEW